MATLSLLALEQPVDGERVVTKSEYESRKAELGQFMTPQEIASFMADQFELQNSINIVLLDAGAGKGALSKAFAERWKKSAASDATLTIHAYELDPSMIAVLEPALLALQKDANISASVLTGDFIESAAAQIRSGERRYTHAILNPPYKKISTESSARRVLSSVGIETVNLYSGFVALALEILNQNGELVAIIPRSFCNGPYYKAFRQFVLDRAAIKSIHLFEARDQAFSEDDVLQENVIIRLKRGAPQGDVIISKSTDASFRDLRRWDLIALFCQATKNVSFAFRAAVQIEV
jgi:adenine-specific DNA-methyltransferase